MTHPAFNPTARPDDERNERPSRPGEGPNEGGGGHDGGQASDAPARDAAESSEAESRESASGAGHPTGILDVEATVHPRGEPLEAVPRRSFGARLLAALRLEPALYEEIEHDRRALGQATLVVLLAALATALGTIGLVGTPGVFGGLLSSFVTWAVWTTIVWLIGVKMFDYTSDFEQLLRTLGFVAAPQILFALAVVPIPAWRLIVGLVVMVMTIVAFVRALRAALDVDLGRAVAVAVLATGVQLLIGAAFGLFT